MYPSLVGHRTVWLAARQPNPTMLAQLGLGFKQLNGAGPSRLVWISRLSLSLNGSKARMGGGKLWALRNKDTQVLCQPAAAFL